MTQTVTPIDPSPLLQAQGLTKVYASGAAPVQALRGVDFTLAPGEMVVLLGASGSGKSTLLNILGALDKPTAGEVRFRGALISGQSDTAQTAFRRDHVGFVFQFYNLVPSLTALENVALVTEIAAKPMTPKDALAMVGLTDRLNHFPAELSGGEQQRVAIARAIAKQPDLLLCDEPTGALDSATGRTVLAALTDVNARLGTATVIITHNAAIAGIAHRVVTMADGQIVGETINATRLTPDDVSW